MKYKVGDKVVLRRDRSYDYGLKEFLESIDYIVTIYAIDHRDSYRIRPIPWQYIGWYDLNIECLYIEPIYDPIENRWEILDL